MKIGVENQVPPAPDARSASGGGDNLVIFETTQTEGERQDRRAVVVLLALRAQWRRLSDEEDLEFQRLEHDAGCVWEVVGRFDEISEMKAQILDAARDAAFLG